MYSLLVYNFFFYLNPYFVYLNDMMLVYWKPYYIILSTLEALHTHFQVPLDVKQIKSDMHHTTAITFPVLNSRDYHQGICE